MIPISSLCCVRALTIKNIFLKGIQVDQYTEEPSLKMASDYFEQAISTGEYIEFCEMKSAEAKDIGNQYESTMWGFMGIIFGAFVFAMDSVLSFFIHLFESKYFDFFYRGECKRKNPGLFGI